MTLESIAKIHRVQEFLAKAHLDGWLLYDFHKTNPLACRFLEIPSKKMATRRFFYWIPARGEPVRIVHAIEAEMLEHLPGEKRIYSSWQKLEQELALVLQGAKRVAMEYSPRNAIPYVSKVDAGTIDLVRSFGIEVVSSADFLLYFTAVLDRSQIESQIRAAGALQEIVEKMWGWIGHCLKNDEPIDERAVQRKILEEFDRRHLVSDELPIVAVGPHSADPHFATPASGSSRIEKGSWILIDLWAKEKGERTVFGDLTRVAVADSKATPEQEEVFHAVREAQKSAISLVRKRFAEKKKIQGWEVDEAARSVIRERGFGDYFIHRTGHSIEVELHGSGTHMDNLEMHDVRPIVPGTCFSIEPGIYLPGKFGVRLESDVLILENSEVQVTGGEQDKIRCLS